MGDAKKLKQRLTQRGTLGIPEEILARAFRLKCRFRAAVRFVIRNLYWLQDIDESVLGDDVNKNVYLLTRKKTAKSLTLQDKYMLIKPTELRTAKEQKHLNNSIGSLKCFRMYPKEVKQKLPGVTYFYYFGPDRVIVRQGDPSIGLYFIISGYVTVSVETVDPVLQEKVTTIVGVMGPGSMFGEVSLLQNIPRTATVTTNTDCELLGLKKHDFDYVLKGTVQQQWNDIQNVMKNFTYFENWNKIAVRECCMLSKLNVYAPNQTILGDGEGSTDHVYFVIKGKCQVIEDLLVMPYIKNKKKCYKLYVPPSPPPIDKTQSTLKVFKSAKKATKKASGSMNAISSYLSLAESGVTLFETEEVIKSLSVLHSFKNESITEETRMSKEEESSSYYRRKMEEQIINVSLPPEVETHFMRVCSFGPTACFGIGENMKNRRIIAVPETKCLVIPRNWLMQQNNRYVWHKVLLCLNRTIPSTKQLFQEFLDERKWMAYRKKLVADLMKNHLKNINRIENVPYSIRISQQLDYS